MEFIKKHAVAAIAVLAAILSCFLVLPDKEYIHYFDTRVLMSLFCFIAVITALEITGVFRFLAGKSVRYFDTLKHAAFGLVFLTTALSMFVSNDVALLTILPLTYMLLKETGNLERLAYFFTLEAVAANLGGMLLPFGSPQNIFLFSYFEIPFQEFVYIMMAPFVVSMLLVFLFCFLVPNERLAEVKMDKPDFDTGQLYILIALLLIAASIILRVTPVWAGVLIPVVLVFVCRPALIRMDWELMLVFLAFFVFAGNMARIDFIQELDYSVISTAIFGSQIISNVPTAILLAQTTEGYRDILIGTNIGGVGTLVASLANLIAYSKYREYIPGEDKKFLTTFSAVNFTFLIILAVLFI